MIARMLEVVTGGMPLMIARMLEVVTPGRNTIDDRTHARGSDTREEYH
jgi:hypothetical protein